jgi:hypothetical protein
MRFARQTMSVLAAVTLYASLWLRPALTLAPRVLSQCAFVLRCGAAFSLWLGMSDAVSGASAAISGLAQYDTAQTTPLTNPRKTALGQVDQSFVWRIAVVGIGSDFSQSFYDCRPLPPGLNINTNIGGEGFIYGTPTTPGTYPVTLVAGNKNSLITVTYAAIIEILGPGKPPVIVSATDFETALTGSIVELSVTVTSDSPPQYAWYTPFGLDAQATNSTYLIPFVGLSDAGDYSTVVSNVYGSTTNTTNLRVVDPKDIQLRVMAMEMTNDVYSCQIQGTSNLLTVLYGTSNMVQWIPLVTNRLKDGSVTVTNLSVISDDLNLIKAVAQ